MIETLAWILCAVALSVDVILAARIIRNRRCIRRAQAERAELLDAADRTPPLPPLRRRTDPLPDSIRHGRDTLRVIARRRPR